MTALLQTDKACLEELRARFAKFGLKLHDGKTRSQEFGRFAASNRKRCGEKRPETFDFLSFTHKGARRKSDGSFIIHRHSIAKRMRATLQAIRLKLRKRDSRLDAQRSYWEKTSSFLTLRDHRKPFSQDLKNPHPSD